jgi:hypothetical protein
MSNIFSEKILEKMKVIPNPSYMYQYVNNFYPSCIKQLGA